MVTDGNSVVRTCVRLAFMAVLAISAIACSEEKLDGDYVAKPKPIVWDTASLMRISEPNVYSGYARLIELQDGSWFVVYSNSEGIIARRSYDRGLNWSTENLVIPNTAKNFVTNAEAHQLDDGSILVWANYRVPTDNSDTSRRLMIGFVKSIDNGASWSPERIVYRGYWTWEQGVWEPRSIQLPSGEVQVYFANEFPYGGSNTDQEISILSSFDRGETWTSEPKRICYRSGSRDGMPVPIILQNKREIVMAIEDNGWAALPLFKPSIIRTRLEDNWSSPVLANSSDREFALGEIFPSKFGPGSGAPYIAQLPSGQTILSCQSMYNRPLLGWKDNGVPLIAVGDAAARNFTHISQPFDMAADKHGFWNSVTALGNGDILVLTTTDAYSDNGSEEVWMIKGRLQSN